MTCSKNYEKPWMHGKKANHLLFPRESVPSPFLTMQGDGGLLQVSELATADRSLQSYSHYLFPSKQQAL